jgi:photosystem II stability/assembly factor-like uncharacterized protein
MLRPFSIVTILTGLAAGITLACTDAAAPPSSTFTDSPGSAGASRNSDRPAQGPTLTDQQSGTTQRFFAVSPVNARVVWAGAAGGTFALTTNGGDTWRSRVVPGAELLQFRDVHGVTEKVAYLLSAGEGSNNRIYKTRDGGDNWTLQFQAGPDPRNFYDCFDFWTPNRGITFADAINGRFPVIRTRDGSTWQDIGDRLPAAQPGEAGFAASGTCVTTQAGNRAWIGTGGAAKARILSTTDGGNSWSSHDVPGIVQGTPTSGVVSVDFRDRFHGILGGGDVVASTVPQVNVARSENGGRTWEVTTPTPFLGAVYGLSYVPGQLRKTVVATGPGGAAWTPDEGDTWSLLPGITNCWAVGFASRKAGWLGCGAGRIVKVSFDGKGSSDDARDSNHDFNAGN